MAITKNDCNFLFYIKKKFSVSFDKSLMLGRLNLYVKKDDVESFVGKYGGAAKGINDVNLNSEYSEPLFEILGAKSIDSIDYSDYEKATIIHDLNKPIPNELKHRFSLIVDGGTIEHVFNFPVAIKNCMEALKIGGHYIGISPTNNLMGHGFYQFSPELYFRVFSPENGFELKEMLISVNKSNGSTEWYQVADPQAVKERVSLLNIFPISLTFIAEKKKECEIFSKIPQQSDYSFTWNEKLTAVDGSLKKKKFKDLIPVKVKTKLRKLYNVFFETTSYNEELGEFNTSHFVKVNI